MQCSWSQIMMTTGRCEVILCPSQRELKGERETVIHKRIITDRNGMPCRAGLGNRELTERVHSADEYIIYRWKRIQNRAINAQMRPATKWLQPGYLRARQNEMWAVRNRQGHGLIFMAPCPLCSKTNQPSSSYFYQSDCGGVKNSGLVLIWENRQMSRQDHRGVTTVRTDPSEQFCWPCLCI